MPPRSRALSGLRPVLIGSVVLATLLLTVVLGGFTAPTAGETTLTVTSDDEEILTVPFDTNSEIVLEYTHSVERTPVRDVYIVENGVLVMDRMEFSSFGAGLPSEAEVVVTKGRYVYHPSRTEYETLRVMTGPIADHDLVVDGERYDIAGLSDYGPIELTVTV